MTIFLETIRAEGLNHLSYILGDGGQAVVIDPRRDCKLYVAIAKRYGTQISHIFETHRHEDFVVGSLELARRTKAKIHHGKALPFKYGEIVNDGDQFELGHLTLKILETPGHTPESISIAVADNNFGDKTIAVFTGDTLLSGATGRVDLYPSLAEELAGKLYHSIHKKILPLGDQAIIYPAHGSGSICGRNAASREFSTIGYEREHSPAFQTNKKSFIKAKLAEEHYYAPYFRKMERLNCNGVPLVTKLPEPKPVDAEMFSAAMESDEMCVLDIRSPEAFAGAHIPGSLNIPLSVLPIYAGWFLSYEDTIGLVAEQDSDIEKAHIYLMRLGYDNLACYLAGGFRTWATSGKALESTPTVDTATLYHRIQETENLLILDVRNRGEYQESPSPNSRRIWIGELSQQLGNLPRDKKIITLCGSGLRASIAASLIKQKSGMFKDVEICLGSASAYAALLPYRKKYREAV